VRPTKVYIDKIKMLLVFTDVIENAKVLKDVTDGNGEIQVPIDDFPEFARDIGIILARCIEKASRYS
jgi:hypothetical protein